MYNKNLNLYILFLRLIQLCFFPQISEKFTEYIIKDCMARAVPHTRKNFDTYETVKIAANHFHSYLVDIG